MKTLIVEDDFTSRRLLQGLLKSWSECDIAVNGLEAVAAFKDAIVSPQPYQLICLDINMPEMNGQEVLKTIRRIEAERGIYGLSCVKIVITTAMGDRENVITAFREQCDGYLIKPFDKNKIQHQLETLELISKSVN